VQILIALLGHIVMGKLHTAQVEGAFRRLASRPGSSWSPAAQPRTRQFSLLIMNGLRHRAAAKWLDRATGALIASVAP
jgi:hypothetical protein